MKNNVTEEEKTRGKLPAALEHSIFIVWKPEYNTTIPIIDEHHRGIVSIINSLHYGIQSIHLRDTFTPIIDMMRSYTRIHFQVEESFLEMIDFPNAQRHRELHLHLLSQLAKTGRNSLLDKDPAQLMGFLKQWWINHICMEDLIYRDHLNSLSSE